MTSQEARYVTEVLNALNFLNVSYKLHSDSGMPSIYLRGILDSSGNTFEIEFDSEGFIVKIDSTSISYTDAKEIFNIFSDKFIDWVN